MAVNQSLARLRLSLERIDALLSRLPLQIRQHFLIVAARQEIADALRQLDKL